MKMHLLEVNWWSRRVSARTLIALALLTSMAVGRWVGFSFRFFCLWCSVLTCCGICHLFCTTSFLVWFSDRSDQLPFWDVYNFYLYIEFGDPYIPHPSGHPRWKIAVELISLPCEFSYGSMRLMVTELSIPPNGFFYSFRFTTAWSLPTLFTKPLFR